MTRILFLFALLLLLQTGQAQVPRTNIFVFDITADGDSLNLVKPRYLTQFNEFGYNNHPHFYTNDQLLISSQQPYESQPEIYLLDLATKERTRLTGTPEGEYSPRRMPDYFNISAVRMEFNGRDTLQRLWQFPSDLSGQGRPIFRDIVNIGYYHWLTSRDIILFLVDTPNKLVRADVYTNQLEVIATDVGRCFKTLPNGNLVFLQRNGSAPARLMLYDIRAFDPGKRIRPLIDALPNNQDFTLLRDGAILMASGSTLYTYRPGQDDDWKQWKDLRAFNINNISRLDITSDGCKLALVAN